MKKRLLYYIASIILMIGISGCSDADFTTTLDGKWEVVKIDQPKGDMEAYAPFFFNFQNTLFSIQWFSKKEGAFIQGYGFSDYKGNRIFLEMKEGSTSFFSIMELLQWDENKCSFQFEKNNRKLKLIDGNTIYYLKKY